VAKEGLIVRAKMHYYDHLDMAIPHAYVEKEQDILKRATAQELEDHDFSIVMTPLPKSTSRCSEFDNDLPKLYFGLLRINETLTRNLKPGDVIRGVLPTLVLKPVISSSKIDASSDAIPRDKIGGNADGTFILSSITDDKRESSSSIEPNEKTHKNPREEHQRQEKILRTMTGILVKRDFHTPSEYLPVVWQRNIDSRFQESDGNERHVDTEIPAVVIQDKIKYMIYKSLMASEHVPVKITLPINSRSFQDTLRNFNTFLHPDTELTKTHAKHHLANYLLGFDDRLDFPDIDYFEVYAPQNWKELIGSLLPDHQLNAFENGLKSIHHGLVPILGVPGAAKTFVSVVTCVLPLAKSLSKTSLMVTGTNKGADSLALMADYVVKSLGIQDVVIIRMGNVDIGKLDWAEIKTTPRDIAKLVDIIEDEAQIFLEDALSYGLDAL
jgi:hypothetical protein